MPDYHHLPLPFVKPRSCSRLIGPAAALLLLPFAIVGCDDPADDVAAAEVQAAAEEAPAEQTPAEEPPTAATEALTFSNQGSTIGFVGSKVTASHEGGFREFAGELQFNPSNVAASSIQVTIQTASLFADSEDLTNHLKNEDFFDVTNHPTATFRSTEITEGAEGDANYTITGNLNLHGVEQQIRFPATVRVSDSSVQANAEFSINRQDFGINYPGRQDDLIRDRVVLRFSIAAPRN